MVDDADATAANRDELFGHYVGTHAGDMGGHFRHLEFESWGVKQEGAHVRAIALDCGSTYACAVTRAGRLLCFAAGPLPFGGLSGVFPCTNTACHPLTAPQAPPRPQPYAHLRLPIEVDLGHHHAIPPAPAITAAAALMNTTAAPVLIGRRRVRSVSCGRSHLCVILDYDEQLYHTRIIRQDMTYGIDLLEGRVWCLGNNNHGQLGLGSKELAIGDTEGEISDPNATLVELTAAPIATAFDLENKQWERERFRARAIAVACGAEHSCALMELTGEVYCWGSNAYMELGQPNTTCTLPSTSTSSTSSSSASSLHSLDTCLGDIGDDPDELGSSLPPLHIGHGDLTGRGNATTRLVASNRITCIISAEGILHCWGGFRGYGYDPTLVDSSGSSSTGVMEPHFTPQVGLRRCRDAIRIYHARGDPSMEPRLACERFGTHCTYREEEEEGEEEYVCVHDPSKIFPQTWDSINFDGSIPEGLIYGDTRVIDVSVGTHHVCAVLLHGGTLRCWGLDTHGQTGGMGHGGQGQHGGEVEGGGGTEADGIPATITDSSAQIGIAVGATRLPLSLTCGAGHCCVLLTGGIVKCFGSSSGEGDGELGRERIAVIQGRMIDPVIGFRPVGEAQWYAFDSTFHTDLGREMSFGCYLPAVDLGGLVSSVSAGAKHSCALMSHPLEIVCWGSNRFGQLGRDSFQNGTSFDPTMIPTTTLSGLQTSVNGREQTLLWAANEASSSSSQEEEEEGVVYASEHRRMGSFGLRAVRFNTTSLRSGHTRTFVSQPVGVECGGFHTCAWFSQGSLVCWGANEHGQTGYDVLPEGQGYGQNIGDSPRELLSLPGPVPRIPRHARVLQASLGTMHTCVVMEYALPSPWSGRDPGPPRRDESFGFMNASNPDDRALPNTGGNVRCFGLGVVSAPPFNASWVSCGLQRTCILSSVGGNQRSPDGAGDVAGKPGGMGQEVWCQGFNRQLNTSTYHSLGTTLQDPNTHPHRKIIKDTPIRYETSGEEFIRVWRSALAAEENRFSRIGNLEIWKASLPEQEVHLDDVRRDITLATHVVRVRVGGGHTCILFNTGMVECFGSATTGQLGYSNVVTNRLTGTRCMALEASGDPGAGAVHPVNFGVWRRALDIQPSTLTPETQAPNHTQEWHADEGYSCALLSGNVIKCFGDGIRYPGILGKQGPTRVGVNTPEELGMALPVLPFQGCPKGTGSPITGSSSGSSRGAMPCPAGTYHSPLSERMACSKCASNVPVIAHHVPPIAPDIIDTSTSSNTEGGRRRRRSAVVVSMLGRGHICAAAQLGEVGEPCGDRCVECDAGRFSTVHGANHTSFCRRCVAGKWSRGGSSRCTSCYPGFYATQIGLACLLSTAGSGSEEKCNADVCTRCPSGMINDRYGAISCEPCAAGRYAPRDAFTGGLTDTEKGQCLLCPAGSFSGGSSAGTDAAACGGWQHEWNQKHPSRVHDGKGCGITLEEEGRGGGGGGGISSARVLMTTSSSSSLCPHNTTCAVTCRWCIDEINGDGVTSFLPRMGNGSSVQDCVCKVGYILDERSLPASAHTCSVETIGGPPCCMKCLEWMDCTLTGQRLSSSVVLPNYWRKTQGSTDGFRCLVDGDCLGGEASGCRNGTTGPLCSVCEPGYTKSLNASCEQCPENVMSLGGVLAMVAGLGAVLILVTLYFVMKGLSADSSIASMYLSAQTETAMATQTPYQSFKITVTFVQILSSFFYTFTLRSIPWPTAFYNYLGKISLISLLSFLQVPIVGCFLQWKFYGEFGSFAMLPAGCIAFIAIVSRISIILRRILLRLLKLCCKWTKWVKNAKSESNLIAPKTIMSRRCKTALFIFLWYIYPAVVSRTLRMFNCVPLGGGEGGGEAEGEAGSETAAINGAGDGTTVEEEDNLLYGDGDGDGDGEGGGGSAATGTELYLVTDYSIRCDEDEYLLGGDLLPAWKKIAQLSLVLWCIGIPLCFALLLMKNRKAIFWNPDIQKAYSFVYEGYEDRVFWWEVVVFLYKMCICGALTLAKPDSTLQVIIGIIIVTLYLVLVLHYRPYEEESDYRLAVLTQFALFATLLCGLFLRIEKEIMSIKNNNNGGGEGEEDAGPPGWVSTALVLGNTAIISIGLFGVYSVISAIRNEKKKRKKANAVSPFNPYGDDDDSSEWIECWDPNEESYYYYNTKSGESSWEPPEGDVTVAPARADSVMMMILRIQGAFRAKKAREKILAKKGQNAAELTASSGGSGEASHPWVAVWEAKYNCNYYYNKDTGASVWEKPPEMEKAEKENTAIDDVFDEDEEEDDFGGGYAKFLGKQYGGDGEDVDDMEFDFGIDEALLEERVTTPGRVNTEEDGLGDLDLNEWDEERKKIGTPSGVVIEF